MATYAIRVEETLSRTVLVEADNVEDAEQKVEDMYGRAEIVLDSSDYDNYNIHVSKWGNPDGTASDYQLAYCERVG